MSQVLAITNETHITPEPSNVQRVSDDFPGIFEKEKQKIILHFMVPMNLQLFSNAPIDINYNLDRNISKIESDPQFYGDHKREVASSSFGNNEIKRAESKDHNETRNEACANSQKTDQLKVSTDIMNKFFVGELKLTSDVYSRFLTAKNMSPSLVKIDLDDLISQIKDRVRIMKENSKMELSISLKPENLGNVTMNISSNKGVISIAIYADKIARDELNENIQDLERALKNANLNIAELNVFSDDKRG